MKNQEFLKEKSIIFNNEIDFKKVVNTIVFMKKGFILPSDFVRNNPKLWWDIDLENNIKFTIDQEKHILGKRLEKTDGTIELQLKMELSKEIISLFQKEFNIKVL